MSTGGTTFKKEHKLNQNKPFKQLRAFFYLVSRHSNIPKIVSTGSLLPVNRQLNPKKIQPKTLK